MATELCPAIAPTSKHRTRTHLSGSGTCDRASIEQTGVPRWLRVLRGVGRRCCLALRGRCGSQQSRPSPLLASLPHSSGFQMAFFMLHPQRTCKLLGSHYSRIQQRTRTMPRGILERVPLSVRGPARKRRHRPIPVLSRFIDDRIDVFRQQVTVFC
jgi:hypothetical protein